jgi:hypothetical protein
MILAISHRNIRPRNNIGHARWQLHVLFENIFQLPWYSWMDLHVLKTGVETTTSLAAIWGMLRHMQGGGGATDHSNYDYGIGEVWSTH